MNLILLSLAFVSMLSLAASLFAISKLFNVMVELESFKKSTHSVQFVGANKEDINVSKDIEKFEKEYREEAQIQFPNFATLDEDLELKGL